MKIKLKPFSRLTIVFILAVTIPGSMLTYLSVQNITNLKELTEKKVLEEEKELAELVYLNFQNKLNEISREFTDYVSEIEKVDYSLVRFSDTLDFIENPFIIDQNGKFLWPEFITDIDYKERQASSANFVRIFSAAEKSEFTGQNYPGALSRYLRALSYAGGKADSAQAINAIARLHVKSNNYTQALKYYSIIISEFYSVLDKNELPYINYAITQLINISDTNNIHLIYDEIKFVLSRMVSGKIPLNYSTNILIDEMSDWINRNSSLLYDDIKETEKNIHKMKDQVSFFMNTHSILKDFVLKDKMIDIILPVEDYYAISGTSINRGEPVIINPDPNLNLSYGFVLDIEELKQYSININTPSTFRFEYKIEIIESNINLNTPGEGLMTISKLSPLPASFSVSVRFFPCNVEA